MNRHTNHIEASEELARLLDELAGKEEVVITRKGRPVACLMPMRRRSPEKVREAIRRLRELRKETTLGSLDWRELRDLGRK